MSIAAVIMRLLLLSYADIGSAQLQALFPTYFDVFGSGMISAYFVVYARNKLKKISELKPIMTAISALCLFIAVCYIYWLANAHFPDGFQKDVYFRFLYRGLFAVILSGFIFTACFSYDFWEKKIWGNRFFVFLSSISYTVYLWHQNIFIFLKKVNLMNATTERVMDDRPAMWRMVLICWSASLIIGWLVTKYIETPVVKYGFKGCADKIISATAPKQNKNKKHKSSR
jgi:peptidoglycan/LPS O-acetylase OafA/YrhL